MKGLLIAADFVVLPNGTPRLLEINTDVKILSSELSYINFQPLVDIAVTNNLDGLTVVNKPSVNPIGIFSNLSSSCASSSLSFDTVNIDSKAIVIPEVSGSDNLLVVRTAYDANAIVDSTYARDNHELYALYNNKSSGSSVVNSYFSSSVGEMNSLEFNTNTINGQTVPNIIIKKRLPDTVKLDFPYFYNLNSQQELDTILTSLNNEDVIVNNYVADENSLTNDKIHNYIRKWYFLYGADLTVVELGGVKFSNQAPLKLPLDWNGNKVEKHEKKALVNNATFATISGVPSNFVVDKLVSGSKENVEVSTLNVGDTVESIHIPNFSYTESETYAVSGKGYPTGSFISSSIVQTKTQDLIEDHLIEFTFTDNSKVKLPVDERVYGYSVNNDKTSFYRPLQYKAGDSLLVGLSGSLEISSSKFIWYSGSFTTIDVEETDAFIGGTVATMNLFLHNCFVKDTLISTPEGSKAIQDIKPGDKVLSFNRESKVIEEDRVLSVDSTIVEKTIKIVFEEGETVITTPTHPFYVDGKGWCSVEPTNHQGELIVGVLKVGDKVVKQNINSAEILSIEELNEQVTVYNITSVEKNQSFLVNGFIVHNKKAACQTFQANTFHGCQYTSCLGSQQYSTVFNGDTLCGTDFSNCSGNIIGPC